MDKSKIILDEIFLEDDLQDKVAQVRLEMKAWTQFQKDINLYKSYSDMNMGRGGVLEGFSDKLKEVSKLVGQFKKDKENIIVSLAAEVPLIVSSAPMEDNWEYIDKAGQKIMDSANIFGYNYLAKRANTVWMAEKYMERVEILKDSMKSMASLSLVEDLLTIFRGLKNKFNEY